MTPLLLQIRAARAAKGWSQRDLAREMNVSQQTIAQWESGGMPRGKRHEKLHELLGTALFKPEDRDELSLRDSFAAKAMQSAYLHFSADADVTKHWTTKGLAESAYAMADAMLKARTA